jgi:RNA polymerase sigma-70 factor (ECF subfamily)
MPKAEADGIQLERAADCDPTASNLPRRLSPPASTPWIRGLLDLHFDFIWRTLRRLGVPEDEVDDAAQKVFLVALRRRQDIALGSERAFLFSTAVHTANDVRRARARKREISDEDAIEQAIEPMADAEELLDRKRARKLLDDVLDAMELQLRLVFVLAELEELTAPEIASLLGVPIGTVGSRLRRARDEFRLIAKRLRARATSGVRDPDDPPGGGES